jgi:hypothetical protein
MLNGASASAASGRRSRRRHSEPAAGPVVAKRFGTVDDDGFRIESVAYESVLAAG